MNQAAGLAKWLARTVAVVLLVIVGSTALVRFAPGYLSDAREMDPRYAQTARAEVSTEAAQSQSLPRMLSTEVRGWMRGDAGVSRQYGVPVSELIVPRLRVTGSLIFRGLCLAWVLALCASIVSSAGKRSPYLWQVPALLLLAVPTAALATIFLVAGSAGPVFVMALLLAARDFKFLHRAFRQAWLAPDVFHARAQGIGSSHLLYAHILPTIAPQLAALASLSVVTALSALVPVEVIFDVPGLGQLAWSAAMNRDLPVLLAVTVIMALAVTAAGITPERRGEWNRA